ncbi:phosphodiester glycosidase family protein [Bacteroides sp. 214]|uniref:phosphodiester glycosidase family protein n=1 Tax=Bacteroides sp. 214 TaxID=2302935 RepID=UPI0013D007EF|nr:phosphodiester glycosidase family protein [Bacteroides sp. 214]NDW13336.1 phosphodiester glycosidase family protein [Bacteroides sp. 214]
MKHVNCLLTLVLLLLSPGIFAQTAEDSLIIVGTQWKVTELDRGLVVRQAEIPVLYQVPQNISIIEIDPKRYAFNVVVNSPKAKTSEAGKSTNAIAAINGSYFDVPTGASVCYYRIDKNTIDTTTTREMNLRVTGAMRFKKGKITLIPWGKEIEKAYNKKKGTVLATGPLMLKDGKTCDFSGCSENFIKNKHPRSAMVATKKGKILLIAVDGRFPGKAEGVSIIELAHFARVLGGDDAINLDGGGSTTLWAADAPDGGVLNKLSDNKTYDNKGERKVANSVCVYRK